MTFSRVGNSPNSKKIKFKSKSSEIFFSKMGRDIFTKFSGFVGVRGPLKGKSKNWGSDPQFRRGWGANFSIGPRSAPSGGGTVLSRPPWFCWHISQWAPIFDFFQFLRGSPTPTRKNIGQVSSAFCRAPDDEQTLQILRLCLVRFRRYGPSKLVPENLGEK